MEAAAAAADAREEGAIEVEDNQIDLKVEGEVPPAVEGADSADASKPKPRKRGLPKLEADLEDLRGKVARKQAAFHLRWVVRR